MLSKLVLLLLLVSLAGSAVAAPHGIDPTLMAHKKSAVAISVMVVIWLRPLRLLSNKLSRERRALRIRRPLANPPTLAMPPLTVQMLPAPHQVWLRLRHRVQLPALQLTPLVLLLLIQLRLPMVLRTA
ncbi:hypothetical protein B0H14DRAFT_1705095 [Mycena olivaceomarginata]|nr:hypothetical protein B0H14DRAFT_1705095 [Mycena olivaceomarginata]